MTTMVPFSQTWSPYGSTAAPPTTYNPFQALSTATPSTSGMVLQVKSVNPFSAGGEKYSGVIGRPNDTRSVLRPSNDKLDRLVSACIEKLDFGLQQINALAEDTKRMQNDIASSHTGGDPELRTQLSKANKEIHRLRTVLATQPGAVAEEAEEEEEEEAEEGEVEAEEGEAVEDPKAEEGPVF
eukprot:CAMPEP_0174294552 /NCGR_PEP_ID=MMETSP0809-20121228/41970_1 /TAXON_ID=73025 ORGANISM="Eutreptiella gymnastica-like, Strain CCMP1594" /NCGR_SAMPLE_ID=MMETSP0809 /ASSEMBLY_ACC=CAM_ASM_000658 /LENGTH=182 /DNA_ID=CAMNT_0015396097 /DNA_START=24 /DNA_END=572 /DNA_ORIENTATION=+